MMGWLQRLYSGVRAHLTDRKRRIFIGKQHLELIAALDRKLARLIRKRDLELAILAECFLNADELLNQFESFTEIIQEIRRLELERNRPIEDSSSSLTSLVIPDSSGSVSANVSDMELIDPIERNELYRRRLRGLYMDLGEMVLAHEAGLSFPEQVSSVEAIRSQLSASRQEREALIALLPSSNRVLVWIKMIAIFVLFILLSFAMF